MSELKHLRDFEGYRPVGEVNTLAEYFRGHGQTGELGLASDSISEALREKNGLAPYIGNLVLSLKQHLGEDLLRRSLSVGKLEDTNLTELFKNRYEVDMEDLRKPLRLHGGLLRGADGFFLNYQMQPPQESQRLGVDTFWQLSGSGSDSFLNMSCVNVGRGDPCPPLTGSGNIAFVPGVEEAITADIEMLIQGK